MIAGPNQTTEPSEDESSAEASAWRLSAQTRILRFKEISARVGVPEPTLRDWYKDGFGPRMFKLGRNTVSTEADVAEWLGDVRAGKRTR